jgi:hypothetical protein
MLRSETAIGGVLLGIAVAPVHGQVLATIHWQTCVLPGGDVLRWRDPILRVEHVGNGALDLGSMDLVVPLGDVPVLAGQVMECDDRAALDLQHEPAQTMRYRAAVMFVILTQSGGVAAAFHSEAEALDTIRTAHDAHGRPYAARYQLVSEDGRGASTPIASGDALVERALAARR